MIDQDPQQPGPKQPPAPSLDDLVKQYNVDTSAAKPSAKAPSLDDLVDHYGVDTSKGLEDRAVSQLRGKYGVGASGGGHYAAEDGEKEAVTVTGKPLSGLESTVRALALDPEGNKDAIERILNTGPLAQRIAARLALTKANPGIKFDGPAPTFAGTVTHILLNQAMSPFIGGVADADDAAKMEEYARRGGEITPTKAKILAAAAAGGAVGGNLALGEATKPLEAATGAEMAAKGVGAAPAATSAMRAGAQAAVEEGASANQVGKSLLEKVGDAVKSRAPVARAAAAHAASGAVQGAALGTAQAVAEGETDPTKIAKAAATSAAQMAVLGGSMGVLGAEAQFRRGRDIMRQRLEANPDVSSALANERMARTPGEPGPDMSGQEPVAVVPANRVQSTRAAAPSIDIDENAIVPQQQPAAPALDVDESALAPKPAAAPAMSDEDTSLLAQIRATRANALKGEAHADNSLLDNIRRTRQAAKDGELLQSIRDTHAAVKDGELQQSIRDTHAAAKASEQAAAQPNEPPAPAAVPQGPVATIAKAIQDTREAQQTLANLKADNERRSLERAANTDALTNMGNTRAYQAALPKAEADPNTAVLRFDLNGFKNVNDTHGHDYGDRVIKRAAKVIRQHTMGMPNFRPGGDEFVAFVPADQADAIREAVEDDFGVRDIVSDKGQTRVSISGGAGNTSAEADAAAYAAKEAAKKLQGIRPRGQEPGSVYEAPLTDLDVEPERFQFKGNTNEHGVTNALEGVKYNKDLAGVVNVWRDPADGRLKVVNGHHRVDLARRSGVEKIGVREVNAGNAKQARAIGALINIAEDKGTPVDVAKFIRDSGATPAELQEYGVNAKGKLARQGLALSQLHPALFNEVATGRFPVERAAIIGESGLAPEQQLALTQMLEKREASGKHIGNAALGEMIRFVKDAGTHDTTQESLFGTEHLTQSLAPEKAELSAWVKDKLAKDRRLFSFLSKNDRAARIEGAGVGNIETDRAKSLATSASQAEEVYNRLSTMQGPVSAALSSAARELANGGDRTVIRKTLYEAVSHAVEEQLHALGGRQEGSVRGVSPTARGDEAPAHGAGSEAAAGGEAPAPYVDPDQVRLIAEPHTPYNSQQLESNQRSAAAERAAFPMDYTRLIDHAEAKGYGLTPAGIDRSAAVLRKAGYSVTDDMVRQAKAKATRFVQGGGTIGEPRQVWEKRFNKSREQLDLFGTVNVDGKDVPTSQLKEEEDVAMTKGQRAAVKAIVAKIRDEKLLEGSERQKEIAAAAQRQLIDPVGMRMRTKAEAAYLMTAFRHPAMEILHAFLKDDEGTVLAHIMRTSGQLNWAAIPTGFAGEIANLAERTGATTVTFGHNHPSGNPTPSHDDIAATSTFRDDLKGYGLAVDGHVIINHDKASWVDVGQDSFAFPNNVGPKITSVAISPQSSLYHRAPYRTAIEANQPRIAGPDAAAAYLSLLAHPSASVVFAVDAQHNLVGVSPVLPEAMEKASSWLPDHLKKMGASAVLMGMPAADAKRFAQDVGRTQNLVDESAHWSYPILDVIGIHYDEKGKPVKTTSWADVGFVHPKTVETPNDVGSRTIALRPGESASAQVERAQSRGRLDASETRSNGPPGGVSEGHRVGEPDLFGNPDESEPTQGSLFSSREGSPQSLSDTERAAKAELAKLKERAALLEKPSAKGSMNAAAERIKVARRIAELERLLNRDKAISADEMKTRARADSEPDLFREPAPAATRKPFNEYIRDMHEKIAAKRAPVRAAVGDGKRPVEFQTGPEHVEVITREARDNTKWRVTHFAPDGPIGHQEYNSLEDAIAQVAANPEAKPVKGVVQQWMQGDRWQTRRLSEPSGEYGKGGLSKGDVQAFADRTKQELGLQDFSVYLRPSGELQLAGIEVPKSARKQGIGTKAMDALTAFADQHGARITLTPALHDPLHGTTSRARLVRFYKRFGFVENKGRNKDFAISDGMYRNPRGTQVSEASAPYGAPPELPERTVDDHIAALRERGMSEAADNLERFMKGSQVRTPVFHGTTHDFDTFSMRRASPESHFGRGFYFSSAPSDVNENYAGEGPDLTNRIEQRVDQLMQDVDARYGSEEYEAAREKALAKARAQLAGQGASVMPVYLSIKHPLELDPAGFSGGGTQFTLESEYDKDGEFTGESGNALKLHEAIQQVAPKYDLDPRELWGHLLEQIGDELPDGVPAYKVDEALRGLESIAYAEGKNGSLIGHEIIRDIYRAAGFDGIVMDAHSAFGRGKSVGRPMEGIDENTKHYIVFNPRQIKSATGNAGAFDRSQTSIISEPPPSYGNTRPAQHPMPEPTGFSEQGAQIRPLDFARKIQSIFNPESLGPESKGTAGTIRSEEARRFQRFAQAQHALKQLESYIEKQPRARQVELWDKYERGVKTGDPFVDAANKVFAKVTEERTQKLIAIGRLSAQRALANYIGRFWTSAKNPNKAASFVQSILAKRPFEGLKSFLNGRTLEHFTDGLDAGLIPPTYNYVTSQLAKIAEMERLIASHEMLEREQRAGRAKKVMKGQKPPVDAEGRPWEKIDKTANDPAFTVYGPKSGMVTLPQHANIAPDDVDVIGMREIGYWYAPPNSIPVWHNFLGKGLKGNPIYDMLTAPGAAASSILLGISGFHGTVIATEGLFSDLALAMDHVGHLEGNEAAKALGRAGISPVAGVVFGRKIIQEYLKPGMHPELTKVLAAMIDGGFRGQASSELWSGERTQKLKKAIGQALHGNSALQKAWGASKVPVDAVYAGIELAAKPLMGKYVPLMKAAATYHAVATRLGELPKSTTPEQMHNEMWDIVKEMDFRFGHVVYDNHFINNVAKNLAQAMFLAPGWTFGTLALMKRGAHDIARIPKRIYDRTQGKNPGNQPIIGKSAKYWVAAVVATMLINGLLTYWQTGEMPGTDDDERGDGWKDFFAFRDGTVDVDGNPNRHTIPGYIMHDVRGWSTHPGHTFLSKLSPFWAFASRVVQNRTYYGDMIRDEDANVPTQAAQTGKEALKEFAPLSLQNYLEARKRDETNAAELGRNAFGINPANREFTRTPAQNRIADLLARRGKTAQTPDEAEQRARLADVLTKLRTGQDASDAIQTAVEHGDLTDAKYNKILRRAQVMPFVEKFKMLPLDQALDVMERAVPWERAALIDILNRKIERKAAADAKENP